MRNPFEVGNTYRNRHGEYEVVELDEPGMVIRYSDGRLLETTIQLQSRIWRNLQAEEAVSEAVEQGRGRKSSRTSPRGATFGGLCGSDFQRGVVGTSWRARAGLGGLLAEGISRASSRSFESYPIPRRAEVHIAQPEHYHPREKRVFREAKFVLELDPERALYGLYVEKNDGPMDATWHWPNLMAALAKDEGLQRELLAAMQRLELQWEVYAPGPEMLAQVAAGADGLQWEPEEGEGEAVSWQGFVERLAAIGPDRWCNLYLCARMSKGRVLAAGAGIAKAAVQVYRATLPAYEAATQGP